MDLINHKLAVFDFGGYVLKRLEVVVVELGPIFLGGEEGGEESLERARPRGQNVDVCIGQGEGDVGVGSVGSFLGEWGSYFEVVGDFAELLVV